MRTYTQVDRLVDELSAPIFVLRMARAMEEHPKHGKSARRRAANARSQIRDVVEAAVRDGLLDTATTYWIPEAHHEVHRAD